MSGARSGVTNKQMPSIKAEQVEGGSYPQQPRMIRAVGVGCSRLAVAKADRSFADTVQWARLDATWCEPKAEQTDRVTEIGSIRPS